MPSLSPDTITQGAVLLPWTDTVQSVIAMFMPGQEAGNAAADILFGDVNPSARLPVTFPNKDNEVDFTPQQYPGIPVFDPKNVNYTEGLLIGYRWYDANTVDPKFPFGHGLSFTTFGYSALSVEKSSVVGQVAVVSVNITNTGSRAGAEVVQLYLGFPGSTGEPPKQLKGFQKTYLQPGQTLTASFTLLTRDVSTWDVVSHSFQLARGEFAVLVGASSREIRLMSSFSL